MHYTGTIWRPPYEAASLLLEVTAGCTHHKCKFCTLYDELPFKFRMSPLDDIENDLKEAEQTLKRWNKYAFKSDEELKNLQEAGYAGLTIGIETGDDEALRFMNKGYLSADIITQCQRLDKAGIHYSFFYLTSISGTGRGEIGAKATAEVCNQLHPTEIGANMLTIYPESELYQEIRRETWQEEGELEKYKEVRVLIENLKIPTIFAALGASNAFHLEGILPQDRGELLATLDKIIENVSEEELRQYRKNLPHL